MKQSPLEPEITALMCTFNENKEMLDDAIQSILMQTEKNLELIIMDDSTKTESRTYLEGAAREDSRIRYVHGPRRLGFVASLNEGLRLSRGRYVARVDADDIQLPERFEKQKALLDVRNEVGVLGCWVFKMGERKEPLGIRRYPNKRKLVRTMVVKNAIPHAGVMYRRDLIGKIGGYSRRAQAAEDYELWMRALEHGIVIDNIQEPLLKYRVPGSFKRNSANWKNNLLLKVRYFHLSHLPYRLAGIAVATLGLVLPKSVLKSLYVIYNSLA